MKSIIKNETEVVVRLSSNIIGNSNDETNFPYKLLSSNRQVANHVKFSQIIYQLTLSYQKLNYPRWCNQEDFLVNFFVHY